MSMSPQQIAKWQEAWESHVDQLASLGLQADISCYQYTEVMAQLRNWIARGAAKHRKDDILPVA